MQAITKFRGEHYFLSNFYSCDIQYEGITYPSVEHAYQAAKTLEEPVRQWICNAPTASDARYRGQQIKLRDGWKLKRLGIMGVLLRKKFSKPELARMLMETGNSLLIEHNIHHDNYWGECICPTCGVTGTNYLGTMLMALRVSQRVSVASNSTTLESA
jgi:ribA/ribD-fused uncharacterized protein